MSEREEYIAGIVCAIVQGREIEYMHCSGVYTLSGMDLTLILNNLVDARIGFYRVKPETRKVYLRDYITTTPTVQTWNSEAHSPQDCFEQLFGFDRWLVVAREYEVETK